MTEPSRRAVVSGLAAGIIGLPALARGQATPFGFETVEGQAKKLAAAPFDASVPPLPEVLAQLDYDAWRDIRFRPDRAFRVGADGRFRLQLFHLGFLYPRPVAVSLVKDGMASPVGYDPALFDLGRTTLDAPLPKDLGYAGIRLHTALNRPDVIDELIVFVGASYFRFLGQNQLYGLSARALAVNTEANGGPEEFPFFRAFWIEAEGEPGTCTIHALLDGPSQTGAYRFTVRPGTETTVAVTATLFPRRDLNDAGLAPLTSMYFIGETDRGHSDDYRPELHDSDGLQIAAGSGEWLWRPLDNPRERRISTFSVASPRGFGLMQRDRSFASYQDLEAGYERRPGYFVEPEGDWGEGSVVLVELPTDNETADNIVAYWRPKVPFPAGQPARLAYRIRAVGAGHLHPNGQVANTFLAASTASGAPRKADDPEGRLARRLLIDFGGGALAKSGVGAAPPEVVASTSTGRIVATSIVPNPHVGGFRVALDLRLDAPGTAELRAYLRDTKGSALTETWTFPWSAA